MSDKNNKSPIKSLYPVSILLRKYDKSLKQRLTCEGRAFDESSESAAIRRDAETEAGTRAAGGRLRPAVGASCVLRQCYNTMLSTSINLSVI